MKEKILVAGATGKLGQKIVDALLQKGAEVRAIVRKDSNGATKADLEAKGVEVVEVDMKNEAEVRQACAGVECVVSALQGLRDVIVDVQTVLLQAAVGAGVQRFIPSDYSVDFTSLPGGDNRNFDLRREFHQVLNAATIRATSVYNGAFADILTYGTPLLDPRKNSVGYWGDNPAWHLDFTTMDDTAAFTAAAAMDPAAPRSLRIASFQVTPRDLEAIATESAGRSFKLVPLGSLDDFAAYNRQQRAANPDSEAEMYPRWQSGQYMHDMFLSHHTTLDNERYPGLQWTSAPQFIGAMLKAG